MPLQRPRNSTTGDADAVQDIRLACKHAPGRLESARHIAIFDKFRDGVKVCSLAWLD